MRCRNCGQVERFVLLVELAVVAHLDSARSESAREVPDADGTVPEIEGLDPNADWGFTDPDWNLSLACDDCASTDVVGDPARLLAACGG